MAHEIFRQTFAAKFEQAGFAAFCEAAFGRGGGMERDFGDRDILWQVALSGDALIGYAKLRPLAAPAPAPLPGAYELQQIYVRPGWHGTGAAPTLMNWALRRAAELGAPELYLTVFDDNERAKRFYRRFGFSEVGCCTFELGGGAHDDRVWRRTLAPLGPASGD